MTPNANADNGHPDTRRSAAVAGVDTPLVVDTIIIGAGIAGLTAATRCLDAGLSVLVLEARDRVGGRTLTQSVDLDGRICIDLGGAWVNPAIQPHVGAAIADLGLTPFPQYARGRRSLQTDPATAVATYTGDIPALNPAALVDAHLAIAALDGEARRLGAAAAAAGVGAGAGAPLSDREKAMDAVTLSAWMDRSMWTRGGRRLVEIAVRTLMGAEPCEASLLWMVRSVRSAGSAAALIEVEGAQKMRLKEGAQSISLKLADRLGVDRLRLSSPVVRIDRSSADDVISVFVAGSATPVKARTVVLAVPPSQHVKMQWTPPLPARKIHMFQKTAAMGYFTKAVCIYESPFWREEGTSGEAISHCGPISLTYDTSDDDASYGAITCFMASTQGEQWGKLAAAERKQAVVDHLRVLLKDERFASPRWYVEKDWSTEEFTGGCPVAFMSPGTLSLYNEELRMPVAENVFLAGTETATAWIGYMDGAVESGIRASQQVLAALRGVEPPPELRGRRSTVAETSPSSLRVTRAAGVALAAAVLAGAVVWMGLGGVKGI
ncbi:amine oxidase [Zopfochytrium polystomum]|nr:amine oxidase [Zopfochytrium polystomum]